MEKALLEGGGSPAAEQRERNDGLEEDLKEVKGQVEALGKEAARGVAAVRGEVKALGDRQAGFERRLSQVEGTGEDPGEEADDAGGPAKRRAAPWREYPDLVTREPAEGDEEVVRRSLAAHRRVAGAEGRASGPWQGLRVVDGRGASAGDGADAARRARHDASAGEAAAAGLRSERADQLAQDSALRHAEGAEEVGASAAVDLRAVGAVAGHFLRHAVGGNFSARKKPPKSHQRQ